jgi:hypothetical protein
VGAGEEMPDDEPVAGADDIFELNGHVRERRTDALAFGERTDALAFGERTDALAFGEVGVEVEGRRVQG